HPLVALGGELACAPRQLQPLEHPLRAECVGAHHATSFRARRSTSAMARRHAWTSSCTASRVTSTPASCESESTAPSTSSSDDDTTTRTPRSLPHSERRTPPESSQVVIVTKPT